MLDRDPARWARSARSEVVQAKQAFAAARRRRWPRTSCARTSEINRLNREVFQLAIEIGDDADTREWAMHMMLVARALERIGDNAVDIGEQTAFVVTGLFREFSRRLARRVPASICRIRSRESRFPAGVNSLLPRAARAHTSSRATSKLAGEMRRSQRRRGGAPSTRHGPAAASGWRSSTPTPGSCRSWPSAWSALGWEHRVLASAGPARRDRGDAAQRARRRPRGPRPAGLGLPRARSARDCPASASSSAPASRRSPSASAACGWAPTTG